MPSRKKNSDYRQVPDKLHGQTEKIGAVSWLAEWDLKELNGSPVTEWGLQWPNEIGVIS